MSEQDTLPERVREPFAAPLDIRAVSVILRSPVLREGLKKLLTDGGFSVNCPVFNDDPASVISALRGGSADLIIVDALVCERPSQLIQLLSKAIPASRLVIMTDTSGMSRLPEDAISAADGILSPNLSSEALIESLRLVQQGSHVVSPHLTQFYRRTADLLNQTPSYPDDAGDPVRQSLSRRELEILRHLLNGLSNKTIARHLQITEATVKVHVKGLLRKIRAANRTQAAIWAMKNGIGAHNSIEVRRTQPMHEARSAGCS